MYLCFQIHTIYTRLAKTYTEIKSFSQVRTHFAVLLPRGSSYSCQSPGFLPREILYFGDLLRLCTPMKSLQA